MCEVFVKKGRKSKMSTKSRLLALLSENTEKYISGQQAADMLGVSRAAVNKAATALRNEGYNICGRTGLGYSLREKADILTEASVSLGISVPCRLHVYDSVKSTNDVAKELTPGSVPEVVIADSQTGGRGRLGRSFSSPSGSGIYMSVCLKPDFELDKSLFVTMAAAVAVSRAIEKVTGKKPRIKWVNDLFLGSKKICGILTEAQTSLESGQIDRLIIGIGVNCFFEKRPRRGNRKRASYPASDFHRQKIYDRIPQKVLHLRKGYTDLRLRRQKRHTCPGHRHRPRRRPCRGIHGRPSHEGNNDHNFRRGVRKGRVAEAALSLARCGSQANLG